MQVMFASGGPRGNPNTYQYNGIGPGVFADFMAGRLAQGDTATHAFLTGRGGDAIP
jgi:hypothetical protein